MAKTCNKCQTVYADDFDRCPGCGSDQIAEDAPTQPTPGQTGRRLDASGDGCVLVILCIALCTLIGWLLGGTTGAWIGATVGVVLAGSELS